MDYDFSKLTIFDFETTGLKNPQPVQLGFLHYEDSKLVCKKNILINPDAPIEEAAYEVHHISQDMIKDKPTFDEYWDEIKEYFDSSNILIGHNVRFDTSCLAGQIHKWNLKYDGTIKTICTYDNAKKLIPKTEIKNYKLDTVAQYFGINFTEEQHHDAFFDTVACMKIFNKLIDLSDGNLIVKETKV